MNKDVVLFTKEGKDFTFEDILKKIYENSELKQEQMLTTVEHVRPFIRSLSDAITLMPLLTSLQEASIKNDDALVKMAAIVQRGLGKQKVQTNIEDFGITKEERDSLIKEAKELSNSRRIIPGSSSEG